METCLHKSRAGYMAKPESAPTLSGKKRAPRAAAIALILGAIPGAIAPQQQEKPAAPIGPIYTKTQELKTGEKPPVNKKTELKSISSDVTPAIPIFESSPFLQQNVIPNDRPKLEQRNFTSKAVEDKIKAVVPDIADKYLARMFVNAWPNTLDTTVEKNTGYVRTGDFDLMWLRDSSAQLLSYSSVVDKDPALKKLYQKVIAHQAKDILDDPYANDFHRDNTHGGRRWEVDSLCWFLRLSDSYYEKTKDTSIFTKTWEKAVDTIIQTFKAEQRKSGTSPYKVGTYVGSPSNNGQGEPTNNDTGLIHSANRPSDWATTYQLLIPSNIMATVELDKLAKIYTDVFNKPQKAKETQDLSNEVKHGVEKYGTYNHPKYGKMYAYEVDGKGHYLLIDDANVPSLLSLPYLDKKFATDPVYQNTRRYILSNENPYFVQGSLGKGMGSYTGPDQFWPMAICTQILTSHDRDEIKEGLDMLKRSTSGTYFIHESVQKDGKDGVIWSGLTSNMDKSKNYTRSWFAWANGYFGETILYVHDNYPDLLK